MKCEIMCDCDLVYKTTYLFTVNAEGGENWKDLAFMLEAVDKVISFIV